MKTIERQDLLALIKAKSPEVPKTIRVTPQLTLHWTGMGWVREKCSDDDVQLVDTKIETQEQQSETELPLIPKKKRKVRRE